MIVTKAEPFYYPGNSTGCLLIHGFTGAPTEMRPLGGISSRSGLFCPGTKIGGTWHANRGYEQDELG
jgi:carboxylesterase